MKILIVNSFEGNFSESWFYCSNKGQGFIPGQERQLMVLNHCTHKERTESSPAMVNQQEDFLITRGLCCFFINGLGLTICLNDEGMLKTFP